MCEESQLTGTVFMVRPARFRANPQTAESNAFQAPTGLPAERQQARAEQEFDGLVQALRAAGIEVLVFDDTREPQTPDALFPNNWISTHADGRVVLYPMEAPNRRAERRADIVEALGRTFEISEVIDLSPHEQAGCYLEATGSLVLDRANHVAYACLSTRTHLEPLGEFARRLDYRIVAFNAFDRAGVPIYHTNVMMSIGEKLALVCTASIRDRAQRDAVLASLAAGGRDVIELDHARLEAFAGNMLELRAADGGRVIAMSARAHASLGEAERRRLEQNGGIVSAVIDTIETSGGGSVRCMLAEVHLPRRADGD